MSQIILLVTLFLAQASLALELKLIGEQVLPPDFQWQSVRVGGLSGLYYDESEKILYAVCDDRGKYGEPRFYRFDVIQNTTQDKSQWNFKIKDMIWVKNQEGKKWPASVLDLEAITILPWGNLLLSSEGDNNQKPRIPPLLFEIKKDGTWVRDYNIPEYYIPEASGEQKKGIQNNYGFEGLVYSSAANKVLAMTENSLVQDLKTFAKSAQKTMRLLSFSLEQAWTLKASEEYLYQYDNYEMINDLGHGVSEILPVAKDEILVMERGAFVNDKGVQTSIRIYHVKLSTGENIFGSTLDENKKYKFLQKTLVLDFNNIKSEFKTFQRIDNFEGMTWGPKLADGTQTMIMVSDDNFNSTKNAKTEQKTIFLVFSFKK